MPWPFSRRYPERSPEEIDAHEYDYIVVGGVYDVAMAFLLTTC